MCCQTSKLRLPAHRKYIKNCRWSTKTSLLGRNSTKSCTTIISRARSGGRGPGGHWHILTHFGRPFWGNPKVHKEGGKRRVWVQKRRIVILNSYPDPLLSEILYPPLISGNSKAEKRPKTHGSSINFKLAQKMVKPSGANTTGSPSALQHGPGSKWQWIQRSGRSIVVQGANWCLFFLITLAYFSR